MGILTELFRPRALEIRTSSDLQAFLDMGGGETASGAHVTPTTAMQISAVYDCVRVLSEGIAQLPLHLYRRLPGGGKERVQPSEHPVAKLLRQPNPWQTPFEWMDTLAGNLVLSGNAYQLKTVLRGDVREVLPVPPSAVAVRQDARRRLVYEVRLAGQDPLEVSQDQMVHVRGVSLDGVVGLNPIAVQRETIGIGIQLNTQAAKLFKHGSQISGVLEHPGALSAEAATRIRDSWQSTYGGAGNAFKVAILEEGMKFNKTGMTAEDAQFLDSRKFQRIEIASLFRVPPHMINEFDRATWNNIEHAGLEFVTYSLGSHLARIEQRLAASLLRPDEQETLFLQFLVEGYLRGDTQTRFNAYQTALTNAWMSVNEVRELENRNPVPGGEVMGKPVPATPAPGEPAPAAVAAATDAQALKAWLLELHAEAAGRDAGRKQELAQQLARLDRMIDAVASLPAPVVHVTPQPPIMETKVELPEPAPPAPPVAYEIVAADDGRPLGIRPVPVP